MLMNYFTFVSFSYELYFHHIPIITDVLFLRYSMTFYVRSLSIKLNKSTCEAQTHRLGYNVMECKVKEKFDSYPLRKDVNR
jgi:hypothetical protein